MTHPNLYIVHQQTRSYNCSLFVRLLGRRGRGCSTGDASHLPQSPPSTRVQHGRHIQQSTDICSRCRQPCAVLLNGLRCERCTEGSQACRREGCSSPRFFDPDLGEFKYCSPQCRNEDYLTRHAQKLKESLEQSKGRCTVDAFSGSTSSPTLRRSNSHSNIVTLALSTSIPSHTPPSHYMYSQQTHRQRQS